MGWVVREISNVNAQFATAELPQKQITNAHPFATKQGSLATQRLATMIYFSIRNLVFIAPVKPGKPSSPGKSIEFLMESAMLLIILLLVLIFGFGYGGYRIGPGYGYYGGGSISPILTVVLILLLLKVI